MTTNCDVGTNNMKLILSHVTREKMTKEKIESKNERMINFAKLC